MYVLYRTVPLLMTLSDPELHFKVTVYLANGASNPLHIFGSKLGFSGSAERMALFPVR